MLEHPALLIRAWASPANDAPRQRTVLDPESGAYLGHVMKEKRTGTFSFLGGETVKVFETEDASLLMTLSKPWAFARTWQVHDAEERRVGLLYRAHIWNPKGQPLAQMHEPTPDRPGRFVDAHEHDLAVFESRRSDGLLLTFNELLQRDPFAKMAILGRVLLLD